VVPPIEFKKCSPNKIFITWTKLNIVDINKLNNYREKTEKKVFNDHGIRGRE
jgi:hypothetical protein